MKALLERTYRMGRSLYRTLLCVALIVPCFLSEMSYAQRVTAANLDKSSVTFVGKQMNVPTDGKFGKFALQIVFDPAKLNESRIQMDVDLASIDTGSVEANDEVKGKSWFDVKSNPTARFVSTAIKSLGGNRYEVTGKMTIKGRTKDVTAPFTFKPEGPGGTFDGAFTLKRLDYAIGEGAWADTDTVANEVQVKFRISGTSGR
jgi:polyisoprenoid-binding protein YceI